MLSRIRGRITEQQFETWFRGVEPASCSDDVLELTVPNSFSREWLRKRYADVILGAVEQASGGRRPALRIRVREAGEAAASDQVIQSSERARSEEAVSSSAPPTSRASQPSAEVVRSHPRPLSSDDAALAPCLNRGYRLDTFVAAPSTQLAAAAAAAVVEKDSRLYNPLFIHGGVGMGKTHLLQAICQEWMARRPGSKVLFVPCEQFINQFIAAVERGELDPFRARYRGADLLVVDDVQFLADKERTQDEFFHTFNVVFGRNQQIVLAADLPPAELPGLNERLRSRFRSGLVCALEAPGLDSRLALVQKKAERLGQELPPEIARLIAEQVRTNPRELEGAVTRVVGIAHLRGEAISHDLAVAALKDLVVERRRRITLENIAQVVTGAFGVRLADLQGRRRHRAVTFPRQTAMLLARRLTAHSLEEIGGYFGGRDHSTVLYGIERATERLGADAVYRESFEKMMADISALAHP